MRAAFLMLVFILTGCAINNIDTAGNEAKWSSPPKPVCAQWVGSVYTAYDCDKGPPK